MRCVEFCDLRTNKGKKSSCRSCDSNVNFQTAIGRRDSKEKQRLCSNWDRREFCSKYTVVGVTARHVFWAGSDFQNLIHEIQNRLLFAFFPRTHIFPDILTFIFNCNHKKSKYRHKTFQDALVRVWATSYLWLHQVPTWGAGKYVKHCYGKKRSVIVVDENIKVPQVGQATHPYSSYDSSSHSGTRFYPT